MQVSEAPPTRGRAGKALVAFLLVMVALTLAGNALQTMLVPVVTPTSPQRGSLEYRVNASGSLEAASTVPVSPAASARVSEVIAKVGSRVEEGDALASLDASEPLKALADALNSALVAASSKNQALEWEAADAGRDAIRALANRREALIEAEAERDAIRIELDGLIGGEAGDAAIREAGDRLSRAESAAAERKRSLDQLDRTRSYVKAEKDAEAGMEALASAADEYFDLYEALDGAAPADREGFISRALDAVRFSGAAPASLFEDLAPASTLTLRSPVRGEVLSVGIALGEAASSDRPAFVIGESGRGLSLTVSVSEDEAELMGVGDRADIYVGEDVVSCPILEKRVSDSDPSRYEIGFSIPSGYGSVGLRANVRLRKRSQSYDLLVPLNALRHDNDGDFVYVIERREGSLGADAYLRRVDVYVLDRDGTRAALQGGISQREAIVMRGDRSVSSGDRVRVEGD